MTHRPASADFSMSSPSPAEPTRQQLETLLTLFSAGRIADMAAHAQALTETHPDHGFAWKALGVAHKLLGQPAPALHALRQAVECLPHDVESHNNLGILLQEQHQPAEAEAAYRAALSLQPDNPDTLNNLGTLYRETGRLTEAEHAFRHAITLAPKHYGALSNLGRLLMSQEQFAAAEAAFRQALAHHPNFAEALNGLGNLLQKTQRPSEAETAYQAVLALNPEHAITHNNLGILYKQRGDHAQAEAAYRRALQINPDYADAWNHLGILKFTQRHWPDAVAAHQHAHTLRPNNAEFAKNLGNACRAAGELEAAETAYRRALEINPDYCDAYCELGNLLQRQHRYAQAESAYRHALSRDPAHAETLGNLGTLLQETEQIDAAEACYRQALQLQPEQAETLSNLALLLKFTGRTQEAEAALRQAMALNPDYPEAPWNLSLLLLQQGRYAEAWPYYEARYDPRRQETVVPLPELPYPRWQGEDLTGRSLVIWPEQGFGDYLQFVRYLPLLKARGASRLTVLCHAALQALLATVDGVDAVVTDAKAVPPHDYWSFPLSLPLYCQTTLANLPAQLPYLQVDATRLAAWRSRLPEGFKVGLVWQGSTAHKHDRYRSLPGLATLAPLWSLPGVSFVSLQKGSGEEEAINASPDQALIHLGSAIEDFADTAAIVSQLDLLISVDTAIVHLAGALNKPCWVLLPAQRCDWRWLEERDDSPWYPGSLRLFRQPTPGNWTAVMAALLVALKVTVAGR